MKVKYSVFNLITKIILALSLTFCAGGEDLEDPMSDNEEEIGELDTLLGEDDNEADEEMNFANEENEFSNEDEDSEFMNESTNIENDVVNSFDDEDENFSDEENFSQDNNDLFSNNNENILEDQSDSLSNQEFEPSNEESLNNEFSDETQDVFTGFDNMENVEEEASLVEEDYSEYSPMQGEDSDVKSELLPLESGRVVRYTLYDNVPVYSSPQGEKLFSYTKGEPILVEIQGEWALIGSSYYIKVSDLSSKGISRNRMRENQGWK